MHFVITLKVGKEKETCSESSHRQIPTPSVDTGIHRTILLCYPTISLGIWVKHRIRRAFGATTSEC
jgi:hypothetical protein